jgi:protein gp37
MGEGELMAENSKIEWTTHTFNPWLGCTKVSAGCANCYAESMSKINRRVLGVWGPNGTRVVASEAKWKEPLKWDKAARVEMDEWRHDSADSEKPERPRVFCASMADVFEDWGGPMVDASGRTLFLDESGWHTEGAPSPRITMQDVRNRLFSLIDQTLNLDYLLVTKRPENALEMIPPVCQHSQKHDPRPNVWYGASVENQEQAKRIEYLLKIPAKIRFLSVEPLLGPVNLSRYLPNTFTGFPRGPKINWIIVGGESGPNARPCRVEWIRDIVRQCKATGVPVFVKQLGSKPQMTWREFCNWKQNPPAVDCHPEQIETLRFKDPKGGDMSEWPDDLRIREFPKVRE